MSNPKFEAIIDLELAIKGEKASIMFTPTGLPLYAKCQRHENLARAKRRLSDAIDALSLNEMQAFGEYRKAHL